MKKETYTFNMLIMPYEGGYMSMCKETGLIRQGKTLDEAHTALFSAMKTLIKTVCDDNKFEPSLSVGLPFKYWLLFNFTVLKIIVNSTMDKILFEKSNLQDFRTQAA
jgi:predicted RNase H-like HicB family nuclease